ncbi:MAG: response regulator, partial [Muribaculaceae bacterium]|nr:response regulator [Muribaculaceae bacterium]
GIVMVPGKSIPFTYRQLTDYFPDFEGGLSALGMWNDNVIVCVERGRLVMFDQAGKELLSAVVPGGGRITHIEVTEGGNALISVADNGLWQLDLRTGHLGKYLDIPGKYPSLITEPGKPGELFIGVHGTGLMRYDVATGEQRWIPYESDSNTFSNPYITCLKHTPDDKIWIGLYSGIACYDLKQERMLEIDQEPFLKGATFDIVPCLTDSSVWVGTSHGLIHLDPSKGVIDKYTTANGLSDNDVRSITRDHRGGKWIATMHGLSYVPADNDTILSYYGGNGLEETSFGLIGASRDARRIYVGSDLGITSFIPDSLPVPGFGSGVKVSAVFINGKRIPPRSRDRGCEMMASSDGSLSNLRLPYKDNALTLRLSTMDYRDASNIRYMWRLSKNEQWIVGPPGENTINLPHLDPGKYRLEICAAENNVRSSVREILIEISYPWYMTFWAKIVYLIVFLSIIVLAFMVLKKKREERVNEDKIKFFMDVSHDIRSPMTLILSPLESLMKEDHGADVNGKLHLMHRNVQRVMSLMNQLLDIRKLDKGKMRLSCRKTDVGAFVGELVELFRQQASDKGLAISFTSVGDLGEIWLDRDNFDKVMVNLISNAIKYTPKGGQVDVSVSVVDDERFGRCLRACVTDTGIGLDAKALNRLFEPFYRVRESHAPATMGFGIGLDLCRRLVELHHGAITAVNREDGIKGSVFTVFIPVDEDKYAMDELVEGEVGETSAGQHLMLAGASPAGDVPSRPTPLTAGKKILVVDDDAELRGYISSVLGRYYKVRQVSDGTEALKLIADWSPDIVVSDVVMPGMDGLTLLKRLKSHAETNHIPVVLLSSKTAVADRMAGWDKGADAYLG